jgi:uncharacterized membrane protein YdbT with pleckstrin-like domain
MNKKIQFYSVIEKLLSPNEEIKYQFSFGERYLKIKKIAAIILSFVILLSGGLLIIYFFKIDWVTIILIIIPLFVLLAGMSIFYFDWYLKRVNIYIITNKRLIIHRGWFSTNLKSIGFEQITDIKVLQFFIDRIIFKTGTLKINTAGTGDYEINLHCIEDPYKIKAKILEIKYAL